MAKNKNGKQKQKLEEVPEEEDEEYYDYSDDENYGLADMLGGEDNWVAQRTAGGYDPWGGAPVPKTAQPISSSNQQWGAGGQQWGAGGQQWGAIPTPAQQAAASGSRAGGGGGKKGENKKGGDKKGKSAASATAWESWGVGAGDGDAWAGGGGGGGGGGWGSGSGGGWGTSGAAYDANDWAPPNTDDKRWEANQPAKPTHWTGWGEEAKRLPKGHDVRSAYLEQHQQQQQGQQQQQQKGGKQQKQNKQQNNQQQQQQQQNNQQQQGKKGKKNKQNQQQGQQQKQRQNDPWGNEGGWGDEGGWGMPEDGSEYRDEYNDMADRRVHFTPITSNLWGGSQHDSTYNMPSKTLAHAYQGTTTSLFTGAPRNKVSESANVQFIDSKGAALKPVHQALFGKTRMAKDRIHWMFSPNKDERVASLLAWIEVMSYNLGAYGLHRFLQSRERGALITNADYRPPHSPNEPAFDWLTFDQLQSSRDRILQESVAFYDPAVTCIVFVFLPSKSGNSVAMWRRKISIGNNTRASRITEIHLAMAGLRRERDYIVHVDEIPGVPKPEPGKPVTTSAIAKSTGHKYDYSRSSYYPYETAVEKKPKKRRWWHFFRIDW